MSLPIAFRQIEVHAVLLPHNTLPSNQDIFVGDVVESNLESATSSYTTDADCVLCVTGKNQIKLISMFGHAKTDRARTTQLANCEDLSKLDAKPLIIFYIINNLATTERGHSHFLGSAL